MQQPSTSTSNSRQSTLAGFIQKTDRSARNKNMKRKKVVLESECEKMKISGIDVKLPPKMKPYPSQKLMMFRILQSLKSCQNAMIESPTGSGKTLGLLSSVCAWLQNYQVQRQDAKTICRKHGVRPPKPPPDDEEWENFPLDVSELESSEVVPTSSDYTFSAKGISEIEEVIDEDITVISPVSKRKSVDAAVGTQVKPKRQKIEKKKEEVECTCLPRIRIYYGTRTHKQIGQVVKEFSRLPYAGVIKHTILASREHSCIHAEVKASHDITAMCKERIAHEGLGCAHKQNIRAARLDAGPEMRRFVEKHGETVWDLEDLVDALSNSTPTICPYFAATRVLSEDADLIFCPFNYLLEPIIRNSSDVHMDKSIVILDEAHNVEDTCRQAASFDFTEAEIIGAMEEFSMKKMFLRKANERLLRRSPNPNSNEDAAEGIPEVLDEIERHIALTNFVQKLHDWLVFVTSDVVNAPAKFGGRQTKTMSFTALSNSLKDPRWNGLYFKRKENGEGPVSEEDEELHKLYEQITKSCGFMCTIDKSSQTGAPVDEIMAKVLSAYKLSGNTIACLEKFIYFMTFYSRNANGINNMTTYKAFVCIEKEYQSSWKSGGFGKISQALGSQSPWTGFGNAFDNDEDEDVGWKEPKKAAAFKPIKPEHKVTVSLWCMIPALAFRDAFSGCRSVILASGTLTPVDTFESELGMTFKFKMEGDQVIPKEQIFASVIPRGPNGGRLCATYKNINENDSFTAELSAIIKSVCETVPKGILCFFPSYRLLEKVWNYMEERVILKKLGMIKEILKEPRRSSELAGVMEQYERAIEDPKVIIGPRGTGALMFAVFRGKVSEGIDFTDDRARCVISVGIPYPNAVDELVVEKKKYNDESSKPKSAMPIKTLPGDVWYATQAYRALNQALGRCLRHKNDWGALVLVDERFMTNSWSQGPIVAPQAKISKWVKEQLVIYDQYSDFQVELGEFVERMQNRDRSAKKKEVEERKNEAGLDDATEWKTFKKSVPSILIG
ncbi:hypothetical protein QR680_011291 [Steinernema hermaphroditum]|uniref:Helicase ATP-binding domain-containing protein n=1 Tax=Steinernema hermaphroditum TaxID=289476 RepID=A0AA39IU89_9BILA|nr:hypothetical protein QR680_011291 [Steinernema hermaphroditum]